MILPRIFAILAVATALSPIAAARVNVLIAGDRTCAGSTDNTVPYTPAADITVSLNGQPVSPDVRTVAHGIHAVLEPTLTDKDIHYNIVSIDKPISQWRDTDLAFNTRIDYLVWMHGTQDTRLGTSRQDYADALTALMATLPEAKKVFVQPANAGAAFAARPAEEQFRMPGHDIEDAMAQVAAATGASVIPAYTCEYDARGLAPRAVYTDMLGELIGKALVGATTPSLAVKSAESFTVNLTSPSTLAVSTDYASPAPARGFEIWRVTGAHPRMLNITDVTVDNHDITITTNEQLAAGDIVVYGTSQPGLGRRDGTRGNITGNSMPMPVQTLTLDNVAVPEANITGTITDTAGNPVPGVAVSDGYGIAVTDSNGKYALASNKKLGYVFYTLPSGYEPSVEDNGWQIKIHSLLTSTDVSVPETHHFTLVPAQNTHHMMIVGADAHLAARNSDKSQFKKGFVRSVNDLVADNPDVKIYSTILGDLAWDQYWYANNYALPDFVETLNTNSFPVPFFPVMGNHDNDGATPAGTQCDFNAAAAFRRTIAPTYYSYNLGNVHYVVLDDIVYKNTYTAGKSYSTGIVGDRDYARYYTSEQLEWLRRDLDAVTDKTTPVVVCLHIQNWALSTDGKFNVNANMDNSAAEKLADILAPFPTVHILSGHTHYNFHAHPAKYPNIHENNVAGICATWWWTGKLVNRHICKDGSPGGFAVYTAHGKDLSWRYRSSEDNSEPQMRIYDMNAVKQAYNKDPDIKAWLAYDSSQTNYGTIADNTVYINVFNYDTDWTVEVFEGTEMTPLKPIRITAQDPLHVICYEVPRYKAAGTVTADFCTNRTNHMFKATTTSPDTPVTVKLTDSFGNVYTSQLQRPGVYSTEM